MKTPLAKVAVALLLTLVVAFAATWFLNRDRIGISTNSMAPTLMPLEVIEFDDHAFLGADPRPGEIVIYVTEKAPRDRQIGRILAGPGDKLVIREGVWLLNEVPIRGDAVAVDSNLPEALGQELHEHSEGIGAVTYKIWAKTPGPDDTRLNFDSGTIPADRYFIAPDNRSTGAGSAQFGLVPRKRIEARVTKIIASPRAERTGTPLVP